MRRVSRVKVNDTNIFTGNNVLWLVNCIERAFFSGVSNFSLRGYLTAESNTIFTFLCTREDTQRKLYKGLVSANGQAHAKE